MYICSYIRLFSATEGAGPFCSASEGSNLPLRCCSYVMCPFQVHVVHFTTVKTNYMYVCVC